jgi:hypothetical protein
LIDVQSHPVYQKNYVTIHPKSKQLTPRAARGISVPRSVVRDPSTFLR